jgi:hypothetical protein
MLCLREMAPMLNPLVGTGPTTVSDPDYWVSFFFILLVKFFKIFDYFACWLWPQLWLFVVALSIQTEEMLSGCSLQQTG